MQKTLLYKHLVLLKQSCWKCETPFCDSALRFSLVIGARSRKKSFSTDFRWGWLPARRAAGSRLCPAKIELPEFAFQSHLQTSKMKGFLAATRKIPHFLTPLEWDKFERFEECYVGHSWGRTTISDKMICNAMIRITVPEHCATLHPREQDSVTHVNTAVKLTCKSWPQVLNSQKKDSAHWNAYLIARSIGVSVAWKKAADLSAFTAEL